MNAITNYKTTLSASMTSTQTTIPVASLDTVDGHTITMADLGDEVFIVIEPGSAKMEIVRATSISGLNWVLSSVDDRGLAFYGDSVVGVAGNRYAHQSGSTVIISNPHFLYKLLVDLDSTQTITGLKTFLSTARPKLNSDVDAVSDVEFVSKGELLRTALGTVLINRLVVQGVAGETLAAGNLIYLKESDGRWWKADADIASTVENVLLGVAQTSGSAGVAISGGVLIRGYDNHQTGLTINSICYAGNTAGQIVSTTPGTNNVTVAFAFSATEIYFDPRFNQNLTDDQIAALAGTSGTAPSAANKFVDDEDTDGTGKVVRTSLLPSTELAVINAGENISGASTPKAVCLYNTVVLPEIKVSQEQTDSDADIYGTNWQGQTFTTDANTTIIKGIEINTQKINSPGGNATLSIYATSGGVPTGAPLVSKVISASAFSATDNWHTFMFASPLTVSPSTMYAWVLSVPSGDVSNKIQAAYKNSSVYAGGTRVTSSDSGANWSTHASDFVFHVIGYSSLTDSKGYLADADAPERIGFLGFVTTDVTSGNDANVKTSGIVNGFTGLTIGSIYYLSDTAGEISATPGTNLVKVGRAVSATQLLIEKGKSAAGTISFPAGYITYENTVAPFSNSSYDFLVLTGFKPKKIDLSIAIVVPGTTAGTFCLRGTYHETTGKFYMGLSDANTTLALADFVLGTGNITVFSSSTNNVGVVISIAQISEQGFIVRITPTYTNDPGDLPATTIGWEASA